MGFFTHWGIAYWWRQRKTVDAFAKIANVYEAEAPCFSGWVLSPIENLLHYLYFYKRKSFEYEQEVRAIIDIRSIPRDDPYEFGTPVEINVQTLIDENSEVIVSPHADEWITETVERVVERCGFQFTVNPSKILDPLS